MGNLRLNDGIYHTYDLLHVSCLAVALSDGSIFVLQQRRNRIADDITSAKHNGIGASDLNASEL